ncbi:MAG: GDSL-type esterase/lipase family protein [Pelosinus sp.]|nr:GDSL-type esterase/lipase family protein [Pelosinus sp.]
MTINNAKDIRIVAMGDSITYGYPYTLEDSWLYLAAKELEIDCINKGINGDSTAGMVSRFECDVLKCKPSHVIIMGGTNDAYAAAAAKQVIDNIGDMAKSALYSGVIPVIGLPIPCNDSAEEKRLGQYREGMRRYAADNNIEVIDFHTIMVDDSGLQIKNGLHCDGIHPNTAGYKVMAGAAYKFFAKTLIEAKVHDCYWNEDLSCIMTTLRILSEVFHTEIQSQLFSAAYGLNAGRMRSQCGLIEGALMFIGLYAQQKEIASPNIADLCRKFSADFQAEFGSVLCRELRPEGFSPDNPPHLCENITKRAVLFATEFVAEKIGKLA